MYALHATKRIAGYFSYQNSDAVCKIPTEKMKNWPLIADTQNWSIYFIAKSNLEYVLILKKIRFQSVAQIFGFRPIFRRSYRI